MVYNGWFLEGTGGAVEASGASNVSKETSPSDALPLAYYRISFDQAAYTVVGGNRARGVEKLSSDYLASAPLPLD